jgi:WS/DGAT/MGAT family acyltransferase
LVGEAISRAVGLAKTPMKVAGGMAGALRLAKDGSARPFRAARTPGMANHITAARSFSAFNLPLDDVKRIGKVAGGTVNDVLLSVCDDAMQRYCGEDGAAGARRMVALVPVSTRREGDEQSSNAAAATLVALGRPEATPLERLTEIVAATRSIKQAMRQASNVTLGVQTISMLATMELREQLPLGRDLVPHVANFTLSNVPGGPSRELFLGRARLDRFYATPIVSGSNAANFTLIPYCGVLCLGVGAARNIIPDTGRLARLGEQCFDELRAATDQTAVT